MFDYYVFLVTDDGKFDEIGGALYGSNDFDSCSTFAYSYFMEHKTSVMVLQPAFNYIKERYMLSEWEVDANGIYGRKRVD